MLERRTLRRLTLYVLGASVVLVALSFALGGFTVGLGAAVGGAFGSLNWVGMRWLAERIMNGNSKGKAVWSTLLVLKMMLTLGAVWAVLATNVVDPLGFAVGLSGLVLGLLAGAFHAANSGELSASEGTEES